MPVLAGWQNFYVIVGSAAGALIGLQFVVMTLIATRPIEAARPQGAAAFATPTIVHFGTVLLISAIACAPWQTVTGAASCYEILGVLGILYQLTVTRRMHTQNAYRPVLEDWVSHALVPLAAFALLAVSAWLHSTKAMSGVAVAALLLLFTGIHNAWDAVTYHIFVGKYGRE